MQKLNLEYYEKGIALSNYYSLTLGDDLLSSVVRLMKNKDFFKNKISHLLLQGWLNWITDSINTIEINPDIIVYVLGHDEISVDPSKPVYLLSREITSKFGASFKPSLLKRIRVGSQQRSSDPYPDLKRRTENIKGVFSVDKSIDVANKNILVIDDVYTTGSSLKEVGKVLKEANPLCKLYFLTLSIANRKTNSEDEEWVNYFKELTLNLF